MPKTAAGRPFERPASALFGPPPHWEADRVTTRTSVASRPHPSSDDPYQEQPLVAPQLKHL
jgi:hypothetical protein